MFKLARAIASWEVVPEHKQLRLCIFAEQVLAKLAHPNIVAYYGSFMESDDLNVVMEYADGGTLSSYIQKAKAPFSEAEIMRVFVQARAPFFLILPPQVHAPTL